MVFQSSDEVAVFICQTVWDSYGYPYETVNETTWDEVCESFFNLYVPGMLRETLEKFVIAFVYHQARRDKWDQILLSHLYAMPRGKSG